MQLTSQISIFSKNTSVNQLNPSAMAVNLGKMICDQERQLRQLQKECARAVGLYFDLSEAVCEILTQSATAPLSPSDRSQLRSIQRQELAALKAYRTARLRLMTALSLEFSSEREAERLS